jgi:hypothetical protein
MYGFLCKEYTQKTMLLIQLGRKSGAKEAPKAKQKGIKCKHNLKYALKT